MQLQNGQRCKVGTHHGNKLRIKEIVVILKSSEEVGVNKAGSSNPTPDLVL